MTGQEKDAQKRYKTLLIPYSWPGTVQPMLSREFRELLVQLCEQYLRDQARQCEKMLKKRTVRGLDESLSAEIDDLRAELRFEIDALKSQRVELDSLKSQMGEGYPSLHSPNCGSEVRTMSQWTVNAGPADGKDKLLESADLAFGPANETVVPCEEVDASAMTEKSQPTNKMRTGQTKMWEGKQQITEHHHSLNSRRRTQDFPPGFKGAWLRIRSAVTSAEFELLMAFLILANVFTMAMQFQYDGIQGGYELSLQIGEGLSKLRLTRDYPRPAASEWPGAETALYTVDNVFMVLFVIDVAVRIVFCGLDFWRSALNIGDFVIVTMGLVVIFLSSFDLDPSFLRMLRLVKLARGFTAMKSSPAVQSLQLLLKCLNHSVQTLFWSLCIICVIQCIAAMIIGSALKSFMDDPEQNIELRIAIFRYYGTFSKSILTMFEVLLANWIPACRILTDNVSEWFALLFILYRCLVGFAVLNVVNAVFIQATLKVSQQDSELLIAQKEMQNEATKRNLSLLFTEIDSSGDGMLSMEELESVIEDPKMKTWMGALDIDTSDLKQLFKLLDDGDGEVSSEEFLGGIGRLKGQAKAIDMATVLVQMGRLESKLESVDSCMKQIKPLLAPSRLQQESQSTAPVQPQPKSQPQSRPSTPGQLLPPLPSHPRSQPQSRPSTPGQLLSQHQSREQSQPKIPEQNSGQQSASTSLPGETARD
eukprot:TRINITY_DN7415_c0_g1_i1.p1 TRINITY_DN7415_c0_g1~~TRINITY_DN7415_c0_g1_i1.p1  ORF type:complete len:705 (-),score=116.96 TRINITY_DN7415_c0_g1_i1:171-2285(-)